MPTLPAPTNWPVRVKFHQTNSLLSVSYHLQMMGNLSTIHLKSPFLLMAKV